MRHLPTHFTVEPSTRSKQKHHCVTRAATPLMFSMFCENIWSCHVCTHIQQRFILSTSRLRLNPVLLLAPWPLSPSPLSRLGVRAVSVLVQMKAKAEDSKFHKRCICYWCDFPENPHKLLLQRQHANVYLVKEHWKVQNIYNNYWPMCSHFYSLKCLPDHRSLKRVQGPVDKIW